MHEFSETQDFVETDFFTPDNTDTKDYNLDPEYLKDGIPENDFMYSYLIEISNIPLLTAEQERMLLTEKKGETDQEKNDRKEQLISSNLRLVFAIAKEHLHYGSELIDLINEGNMGLIYAIEHYNFRENPEFRPYAVKCIKEFIKNEINSNRLNQLPIHLIPILRKIARTRRNYMKEHHEVQPSSAELAAILSMDESEIDDLLPYVYKYFLTCTDCWDPECRFSRCYTERNL